jgi:hypothetical protein
MDSKDDFEFKPITEGLGFHKKTVQFKKELDITQSMPSVSMPIKSIERTQTAPLDKRPGPSIERKSNDFRSTPSLSLPFHDFKERDKEITPTANPWKTQAARTTAQPPILQIQEVSVSIPAIIFDSIVVIGLTCLFAIAVLLIVDVDLIDILQVAQSDFMTTLSLVLLFFSVLELYLIIFRSILGATLGEWAFDIQLGTRAEQESAYYPLRVIWRSIINIATGFVTLPILSLLIGKDIAGHLSGLTLKRGDPVG